MKSDLIPDLDSMAWMYVKTTFKNSGLNTVKIATRSNHLLELIHIDICGLFDVPSLVEEKYFNTFINYYLCYGCVYLIYDEH